MKVVGARHNATAAQVSLAWLLAQGKDIIPIPGTMQLKVKASCVTSRRTFWLTAKQYAQENLAAIDLQLSSADLQEVREIAEHADVAHGERYPLELASLLFGDTPSL